MIRVLGIITARGGSKGIPGKNIVPLLGRPLLCHTIEVALACPSLSRLVLSTDDEAIAQVGREAGAEVPFRRPEELARDDTRTIPVLQDAVRRLEAAGDSYDAVFTLQPTNPLRTKNDVENAIRLMNLTGCDSVIGFTPVGDRHPARMKLIDPATGRVSDPPFAEDFEGQPRQQLPSLFLRNGSVYLTQVPVLLAQNSLSGNDCRALIIPEDRALNIDTPFDLFLAEQMLRRLRDQGEWP